MMKLIRDAAIVIVGTILGYLIARALVPPTVPNGDVDLAAPMVWMGGAVVGAIVALFVVSIGERLDRR